MSNGARHGIGAVAGLIATVVLSFCLSIGAYKASSAARYGTYAFRNYHGSELWEGMALLLAAAIVLGLLVGSRVSPIASLIPGVLYTAFGVLWLLDPVWAMQHTARKSFPNTFVMGYMNLATFGMLFLLGVALLVASVPPSRWRARTAGAAAPRYAGPPPAPMGPPPGAPAPLGVPQAPAQDTPWGRPPQYGQQPSAQPPAQPQYGRSAQPGLPQAASPAPSPSAPQARPPARPASGAVPFDDNDGKPSAQGGGSADGVGEWTQMYGGDDLRGDR